MPKKSLNGFKLKYFTDLTKVKSTTKIKRSHSGRFMSHSLTMEPTL